jgi:hypothetical protein
MSDYATDGFCHNAEPGTFGHECGRIATWIGTKSNGFRSGFCDRCKASGTEARAFTGWARKVDSLYVPLLRPAGFESLPPKIRWEYVEAPRSEAHRFPNLTRSSNVHGVIRTHRALTPDECNTFDLKGV